MVNYDALKMDAVEEAKMVSLDVNGIDLLVSERAIGKLNELYLIEGTPVCAYHSLTSPNWGCTREVGHTGIHVAHGYDDFGNAEAYAVFLIGDPDYYV